MSRHFHYSAHITFIRLNGTPVPWHVAFTSVVPPFKTVTIGLDTDNLPFVYEDLRYNCAVGQFPRPESLKPDHCGKEHEIKSVISTVFKEKLEYPEEWEVIVAAVDGPTYWYLKDILRHVILLESKPQSDDLTFAAAYRKYQEEKNWTED